MGKYMSVTEQIEALNKITRDEIKNDSELSEKSKENLTDALCKFNEKAVKIIFDIVDCPVKEVEK